MSDILTREQVEKRIAFLNAELGGGPGGEALALRTALAAMDARDALTAELAAARACVEALRYEIRAGGTDHDHDENEAGCDACIALAAYDAAQGRETK